MECQEYVGGNVWILHSTYDVIFGQIHIYYTIMECFRVTKELWKNSKQKEIPT